MVERGAADGAQWRRPLSLLPSPLLQARRPLTAIFVGWLAAFPVSMLLSILTRLLLPAAEAPQFDVSGLVAIFALVVFAPVIETLIMGAVLIMLGVFMSPGAAVLVSAAGWGIAHSLMTPAWGLVIWWPFLIFSTLFMTWRERSLAWAFVIPACAHALQNLLPALMIASGVSA